MKPLLIADNEDSFTGNIAQIFEALNRPFAVQNVNDTDPGGIDAFCGLVISPGPGRPDEFPALMRLLEAAEGVLPVLGICLGHQALCAHFGAELENIPPMHGIRCRVEVEGAGDPLFRGLGGAFYAGRYHSWSVRASSLPPSLRATSRDESGRVMSVRHRSLPLFGVQFHPESILTPDGGRIMANWLAIADENTFDVRVKNLETHG